nr:hypothetical protein [Herpetosiphonaceae bacterium]
RGHTDKIPVEHIADFKRDFLQYIHSTHADIGRGIVESKQFSPLADAALTQALQDFLATTNYQPAQAAVAA